MVFVEVECFFFQLLLLHSNDDCMRNAKRQRFCWNRQNIQWWKLRGKDNNYKLKLFPSFTSIRQPYLTCSKSWYYWARFNNKKTTINEKEIEPKSKYKCSISHSTFLWTVNCSGFGASQPQNKWQKLNESERPNCTKKYENINRFISAENVFHNKTTNDCLQLNTDLSHQTYEKFVLRYGLFCFSQSFVSVFATSISMFDVLLFTYNTRCYHLFNSIPFILIRSPSTEIRYKLNKHIRSL